MKMCIKILGFALISYSVICANPLPFAEITLVSSNPPQVGIKFYISAEDSVILAGDTLTTSGGPAIITPGGALDQPVDDEVVILDSTNTSGFTINPEADSIRLSTLFWDGVPILITEYLGNFGSGPAPITGHQLDNDPYFYNHEQLMFMRLVSFDFCIPDMGWSDVVINEVNAHGTWNGGSNFIELYNKSDEDISLAGWYLVCDTIYDFPENAVIPDHGYYVVEQEDFPPAFDMDVAADNIYLISAQDDPFFDPGTKRRVDQVGWSSDHGENVSFMRYPDGDCYRDTLYELFKFDYMGYDDQSSARTFEDGFPSRGAANRHESPGFTVIGASSVLDDTGLAEIFWTDPVWDESFARSILVKSLEGFPEFPEDGTILYEGTDQHFVDTVIPLNTHTYYTVFAVNRDEELSTPTDESQIDLLRATHLQYLVGDANMIAGIWPPAVIGSDVTFLVNYFRGGMASPACLLNGFYAAADVNGDCHVIGSDVTRLVNYFRGIGTITGCPDYPSVWSSPQDLPVQAPEGWPNCGE